MPIICEATDQAFDYVQEGTQRLVVDALTCANNTALGEAHEDLDG